MKRTLTTSVATGLLLLSLTACGGNAEESNPIENNPTSIPTSTETASTTPEETEDSPEGDEAGQRMGAEDRLEAFYATLLTDNEDVFQQSPMFQTEGTPSIETLVEFAEGPASVLMDHFYLDEDFTDNEISALVILTMMANWLYSPMAASYEESTIPFSFEVGEVIIEGNTAEVQPEERIWNLGGQISNLEEAEFVLPGLSGPSHLIKVDGEWYMDGRETLNQALEQSGAASVEEFLTDYLELDVEPVE